MPSSSARVEPPLGQDPNGEGFVLFANRAVRKKQLETKHTEALVHLALFYIDGGKIPRDQIRAALNGAPSGEPAEPWPAVLERIDAKVFVEKGAADGKSASIKKAVVETTEYLTKCLNILDSKASTRLRLVSIVFAINLVVLLPWLDSGFDALQPGVEVSQTFPIRKASIGSCLLSLGSLGVSAVLLGYVIRVRWNEASLYLDERWLGRGDKWDRWGEPARVSMRMRCRRTRVYRLAYGFTVGGGIFTGVALGLLVYQALNYTPSAEEAAVQPVVQCMCATQPDNAAH
ncbi:MAG: hypothetical protein AAGI68_02465 [Planctomycetota bacterium]